MMKVFNALVLGMSMLASTAALAVDNVTVLYYTVSEPGQEVSFPSRILVSADYVRFDDGIDAGDYALFDRKKRNIYSVTHEEKTIFHIPPREVGIDPPDPISRSVDDVPLTGGVKQVAGFTPVSKVLRVNGAACYNIVAVPGLLPDTVVALGEFRKVLAGEQARVIPGMPADMRDSCDMALNTFAPTWQLEFGLPIQEWDGKGTFQGLTDFKTGQKVDDVLFSLPQGYQQYTSDMVN